MTCRIENVLFFQRALSADGTLGSAAWLPGRGTSEGADRGRGRQRSLAITHSTSPVRERTPCSVHSGGDTNVSNLQTIALALTFPNNEAPFLQIVAGANSSYSIHNASSGGASNGSQIPRRSFGGGGNNMGGSRMMGGAGNQKKSSGGLK